MSGPPATPTPAPPPARSVLLGDAKITIRAPIPRVFEALVNADLLAQWWADDPRIEAELGGRYEGTLADGRIEASIIAIDGPGKLTLMWPVPEESGPVDTTVAYELSPRGPETAIHIVHRAPRAVAGSWAELWTGTLESLKAYLEGAGPESG